MSSYAWIIEKDLLDDEEDPFFSDVGVTGPWDVSQDQIINLSENGRAFKMYDDDDILYYEGKFFGPDELEDQPLYDFGMPNAGCTKIEYN